MPVRCAIGQVAHVKWRGSKELFGSCFEQKRGEILEGMILEIKVGVGHDDVRWIPFGGCEPCESEQDRERISFI